LTGWLTFTSCQLLFFVWHKTDSDTWKVIQDNLKEQEDACDQHLYGWYLLLPSLAPAL